MIALFASITILSNQEIDLSKKVSFEGRAARLENLFPAMSATVGVRLTFSPPLKDHVLAIKVSDVTLKELMDRIAVAATAEWQQESDGYRLIRSATLLRRLEAESLARAIRKIETGKEILRKSLEKDGEFTSARAQGIADQLKNYLEQLSGTRSNDFDFRRVEALRPGLPGYRLAARIVMALDSKMLAQLPLEQKLAFSNRPNRIQVPLSTDIEPQLQLYKREVQALVPHLPVEPKMPDSGVESNIWSTFNLASRISESPHKVLLKITNSYDRGHYSFEFLVANEQGTILDRSYINLSPIENLASRVMAPPEPAPSDEQPIPLSDLSRSYMAALGFDRQSNSTPSPMAPQIRQFLLNPEKNEPGALVFTDLLFGLATLKNWDIVASHHPSAGYYNTFGANMSGAMPSRFLKALAGGWSEVSKVEQKDNWLTVADTDWFGVKSQVYDRAVLGRFVRAAASGATSIDDVAAFAVQTPYRNHFDYGQNLLRILNGNRAGGSDYYHYPLLRFHGSLTPPQKRQSLSEEGLVYSSLNPAQRQLFNTCILNNEGIHSYSQPKVENGQIVEDEFDNNSMRADPYEVYGNGFPADGQLKLTYLNEPMILAAMNRNGREVGNVLFNVSSLANHLFAKESGKMDALSEYSGYRCETREQYRYDIKGHPRLTHSGMLQRTLSTSEKVDSPEKLPPDIWKKVQDELRRYKESVTRRPPST